MPQPLPRTAAPWPTILDRFAQTGAGNPEYQPRRVQRRYHGQEVTLWEGRVHVDDVEGYVENIRINVYLRRWHARQADPTRQPTSDEIYDMMVEADEEESQESRRPFHVARMAESIVRNGVQEPIVIFHSGTGPAELWDGNRRFYGTKHIFRDPALADHRERAQWIPAFVVTPTGDPAQDRRIKHAITTELNFVVKDHIPWPAYVKAEQIFKEYQRSIAADPTDSTLRREVKVRLAKEYGLKGWRVADRWIKMFELAEQFKEYHEEEHGRPSEDVDVKIQDKFEYFDEMSKPGVRGCLDGNTDHREDVFDWLWDGKFQSFSAVRAVPQILADPVAFKQAQAPGRDAVEEAIKTVLANDPARIKDKSSAKLKIEQFGAWLNSFRREDFKQLDAGALEALRSILGDVTRMLEGLQADGGTGED